MSEPYCWNETIEYMTGMAFDFNCPFCGRSIFDFDHYERAHIYPYGEGPGFVPGNIVLACQPCNGTMGNVPAPVWCKRHKIDFTPIAAKLDAIELFSRGQSSKKVRNFRLTRLKDGRVSVERAIKFEVDVDLALRVAHRLAGEGREDMLIHGKLPNMQQLVRVLMDGAMKGDSHAY